MKEIKEVLWEPPVQMVLDQQYRLIASGIRLSTALASSSSRPTNAAPPGGGGAGLKVRWLILADRGWFVCFCYLEMGV